MTHCTVAHYAMLHENVTIKTGRGIMFDGDSTHPRGGRRRVAKSGEWSPAWKTCPVCGKHKLFARQNQTACSRACASSKMWAKRKSKAKT